MPRLPFKDFSLGITDDIVDADPRMAAKMDNLLLNRQAKMVQRPGLVARDEAYPQIPPGNQKIDSVFKFDETVFVKSGLKLYINDDHSGWVELQTRSSKSAFGDSILGAGVSWSTWRGHVFATPMPYGTNTAGCRTIKIYRDVTSLTWTCEQAGVPSADASGFTTGSVSSGSGGQQHQYILAVALRHQHRALVDGVETQFVNYGKPGIIGVRAEEPGGGNLISIQSLQWTNGVLDNYTDVNFGNSSLRQALYRTKSDDSILYFDSVVSQGGTTQFDSDDTTIGSPAVTSGFDDPEFYMNGGRQSDGTVPLSLYSLVLDGYGFYGAYTDPSNSIMYHNRLVQSNPARPEGIFYGDFVEFTGKMLGLDHVGSYPVILTSRGAYRVEGRFDAFGGGGMKVFLIPGSEPAIAGKAVCRIDDAIIYASQEGWIWTNGFQAMNVSKHLRTTYGTLATVENMAIAYDSENKRVYIAVNDPAVDDDAPNNRLYVMDTRFTSSGQGSFQTVTCQAQPNALAFDREEGQLLIGDQRGFVLTFQDGIYSDVKIVDAVIAGRIGIVWDYISSGFSLGDDSLDKFFPKVYGTFRRITGNLSAQFSTIKNFDLESFSKVIRDRAKTGIHKVERWVSGGRWATFQQIRIKKAELIIGGSDELGLAFVDQSALTVERLLGNWPGDDSESDMTGYSIYFSFDDYTTGFEIVSQAGAILTILDPGGVLTVDLTDTEWEIKGTPKDEGAEITSLSIEYNDQGDPNDSYKANDDGANA